MSEVSKDELDKVLAIMTNVVTPIVEHIEKKLPTTKDHYGDYMAAISTLVSKVDNEQAKRNSMLAFGVAMEKAGGNKAGIRAALAILGVL